MVNNEEARFTVVIDWKYVELPVSDRAARAFFYKICLVARDHICKLAASYTSLFAIRAGAWLLGVPLGASRDYRV